MYKIHINTYKTFRNTAVEGEERPQYLLYMKIWVEDSMMQNN